MKLRGFRKIEGMCRNFVETLPRRLSEVNAGLQQFSAKVKDAENKIEEMKAVNEAKAEAPLTPHHSFCNGFFHVFGLQDASAFVVSLRFFANTI